MKHMCHVPRCTTECPAKHLTCYAHWKYVPADLAAEVYRTVGMRHKVVDSSWAPWWEAQAKAIHAAMVGEGRDKEACDKWLTNELKFATMLKNR